MRWFWSRRRPEDTRPHNGDLEKARKARQVAERKFTEAQTAAAEIRDVVIQSKLIRSDNQFSARLSEAFGSRPQTNG